jgi:Holliday junction resolvase
LLGKFLDVVQEELLYVKSDKVREIIHFLTDSHQTLLGKFIDVVQEDILYVKSHKVREIIQFVNDTVIRHCLASL